jgi:5'-nucleotidase / UDP-sugar diphosphatase
MVKMTKNCLTIIHTNDLHNNPGILLQVEEEKNKVKGPVLLLDAGDALKGSNTLFYLKEEVICTMNRLGYSALTMGNREFNYLRWVLKKRKEQAEFPILAANLTDLKNKVNDCFKPFIIKNIDGMKVAIIGLTPVQYNDDSFWLKLFGFRFLDPFKTTREITENLNKDVALVILLSHLGLKDDKLMAEENINIDLIIGGHSHSVIENPILSGKTYIFQAGSHGKYLGKIEIEIKPEIKLKKYQLIPAIEVKNVRG